MGDTGGDAGAPGAPKYKSASENIPPKEAIKLWTASGGRCAFCNTYLFENAVTGDHLTKIGEMAHIVGRSLSPNSRRGDAPLEVDRRNLAENLVLACPNEHTTIDKSGTFWTVDDLAKLKEEHESRIRELTGLSRDRATAVVRVVGSIRGNAPSVTKEAVYEAVHKDLHFPQYGVLRPMATDLEVDLQSNQDENADNYYAETDRVLRRHIGGLLAEQIAAKEVNHVSVFAFARIPVLVQLGHHLGSKSNVQLFDHFDGSWVWPNDGDPIAFTTDRVQGVEGADRVTLLLRITGHPPLEALPAECGDGAVYVMAPAGVTPVQGLIRSTATLDLFTAEYRRFLAVVERDHPEATAIDVVGAVGLTAAVEIGRWLARDVSPPLNVWELNAEQAYALAATVG